MKNIFLRRLLPFVLPVFLFALWWWLTESSTSFYWPPLLKNFEAFREVWFWKRFGSDAVPSLITFIAAIVLASLAGVGLGLLIGSSGRIYRNLRPLLEYGRSLPIPAIIPMALIIFGPGTGANIFLVFWGALWPILINTIDGTRSIDQIKIETARVYGLGPVARLRYVIIPATMPQAFAGLRIGLAAGLAILIVAEMFAGTKGIGYITMEAQNLFDIPQMWAGIFMLALFGIAVNAVFVTAEHYVLAWHRGWRQNVRKGTG